MFEIAKTFSFSASHALTQLPDSHPCHKLHGHNYKVTLILQGWPNKEGMVLDYHELNQFKEWLDATVDHQHLNEVLARAGSAFPPTAECLAHFFYSVWNVQIPLLKAVRVSETESTYAEYRN